MQESLPTRSCTTVLNRAASEIAGFAATSMLVSYLDKASARNSRHTGCDAYGW